MATNTTTFKVTDNSDKVGDELEEALMKALRVCGETAQTYAKKACPVDTGLLRNSITYAVAGEAAAESSYKANKGNETGSYTGTAPQAASGKYTVYLGTNVEYAQDVELGIGQKAQPYIEPAVSGHTTKYKNIIKQYLGGEGQ